MRHQSDEGYVYHAKVRIGDSIVEMGEARDPSQPMPTAIYLYVEDVDAMYERAVKAGATSVLPPTDQPYGDRNAWVNDPFGNVWYLATTIGTSGQWSVVSGQLRDCCTLYLVLCTWYFVVIVAKDSDVNQAKHQVQSSKYSN